MKRLIIIIGLGIWCAGPAYAQQCLHGSDEPPDQQVRRRQALGAARAVNTAQANQPGRAAKRYLRRDELAASPSAPQQRDALPPVNFAPGEDVVPGWELQLEVTEDGYWFMIKDKTDACGFAYISNKVGIIYSAEPIR
jgi:hypothetical protein